MPTFEVEQYELHTFRYWVDADVPAQAVFAVLEGEANPIDDTLELIGVARNIGLRTARHPQLVKDLVRLGWPIPGPIIPSIRSIALREADDE